MQPAGLQMRSESVKKAGIRSILENRVLCLLFRVLFNLMCFTFCRAIEVSSPLLQPAMTHSLGLRQHGVRQAVFMLLQWWIPRPPLFLILQSPHVSSLYRSVKRFYKLSHFHTEVHLFLSDQFYHNDHGNHGDDGHDDHDDHGDQGDHYDHYMIRVIKISRVPLVLFLSCLFLYFR